mmetsp:Transcript_28146/g.43799  ORF Transcript_28146/g.43799 Transcript_28146/m.43799 type:complete len:550 (+) Transcript_28146:161-1810(+)|eukprot:CAMPEP_0196823180 /NCGR_PEP_ID=MMETSP1362-20130617/86457_1 /TAXON_ID=163516 /ORGANISM="Leptocylindrus danicus, Strain CCMP1856" /LENGTH=549 /DNA_ID=CAMNT_0042202971 /DNA_START=150 /DNA_END=1799 /DNA_ORIENTATION=+
MAHRLRREKKKRGVHIPSFDDLLAKRDYRGALVLLEYNAEMADMERQMWTGYVSFHLGDYEKSQKAYLEVLSGGAGKQPLPEVSLYLACTYYCLHLYKEAEEVALDGPEVALQNRLLYHISQKRNNEGKLKVHHKRLGHDDVDDQLSLAAMKFFKCDYQGSIDILKGILVDNEDFIALNVYIAMCYFKQDFYDVALELLESYLNEVSESPLAINLKACIKFRMQDGNDAESEVNKLLKNQRHLFETSDFLRHNLVVFSNGDKALEILPSLVDHIPEARLNLVLYHLRNSAVDEAYELVRDLQPKSSPENIILATVHAMKWQQSKDRKSLKLALNYFQKIGASATECDTIPGRQCMASSFLLTQQFDDANVYLSSIKAYLDEEDEFNWNYGMSLAASGDYKTAEKYLLRVQSPAYKSEHTYLKLISKCFIENGNPQRAWELYQRLESVDVSLLQIIGNECYKMGHFLHSARAFHVLLENDNNPIYWEGERGACAGFFQKVIAQKQGLLETNQSSGQWVKDLEEVARMLRDANNPQADHMAKVIVTWRRTN